MSLKAVIVSKLRCKKSTFIPPAPVKVGFRMHAMVPMDAIPTQAFYLALYNDKVIFVILTIGRSSIKKNVMKILIINGVIQFVSRCFGRTKYLS